MLNAGKSRSTPRKKSFLELKAVHTRPDPAAPDCTLLEIEMQLACNSSGQFWTVLFELLGLLAFFVLFMHHSQPTA